ncbi:hypothetical protein SLE2022_173000 [Rubroshorea leprosula]
MAGEIDEPFSISFQADSLHSGSVSFGRFEKEPLFWERRSSFSHNRYLEEVEKFSKPGSVIEKKAYFEAHFKKKGIRFPGSSEVHYGRGNQTSEIDDAENEGYRDESDNVNEVDCRDQFDKNSLDEVGCREEFDHRNEGSPFDYDYENEWAKFDHPNEGGQYGNENENVQFDHEIVGGRCASFDKSHECSEHRREGEVIECEREGDRALSSNIQVEAAEVNADIVVGDFSKVVEDEETDQSGIGFGKPLKYDEPEKEVEQNLNDSMVHVDESFKSIDSSSKSGRVWEADAAGLDDQKNIAPKFEASVEGKSIKPRLKSQVKPSSFHINISYGTPKTAAKGHIQMEKEPPGRMETKRLSSQAATPFRRALHKSSRKEECRRSNGKFNVENKSVKGGPRVKKAVEAQPSHSNKTQPVAHQTPSRLPQKVYSPLPDKKTVSAAFNFKSAEQAERRKELEEKMHAKEAEMNQIQARTQEKTEAEIKQLRKSLNFKAKPMPSFYHVAATPGSNGSKATSSNTKSTNVRTKSMSQGSGATGRSHLVTAANNKTLSASNIPQSTGEVHRPRVECSQVGFVSTSPDDNHSHAKIVTQNLVTGKKDREKGDSNLQQNHMLESGEVRKDRKVDGRPKVGAYRNSSEMVRKNMKGGGITSDSSIGHLAMVTS